MSINWRLLFRLFWVRKCNLFMIFIRNLNIICPVLSGVKETPGRHHHAGSQQEAEDERRHEQRGSGTNWECRRRSTAEGQEEAAEAVQEVPGESFPAERSNHHCVNFRDWCSKATGVNATSVDFLSGECLVWGKYHVQPSIFTYISQKGSYKEPPRNDKLINMYFDIYFWLRFGLANAINDYLKLEIKIRAIY